MSYWRDEYLCKKISDDNKAALCSVEFSDPKVFTNFEALFNITQGPEMEYADPPPSSLYNIQTLKRLISAGEGSLDITQDEYKTKTFEEAIAPMLTQWTMLSFDLGFCDSPNPSTCDNKHVYMIYYWLDTLYSDTFQRVPEGGNVEYGVVPTLGSGAFT